MPEPSIEWQVEELLRVFIGDLLDFVSFHPLHSHCQDDPGNGKVAVTSGKLRVYQQFVPFAGIVENRFGGNLGGASCRGIR